ncbi:U4/U6.U5 tri-snRNP-associated protein 2 [Exaiptasia diaphana]|nr:U4/U6.U5 tri-snRNP-associated protein 2 [Exaiptasia diaphana]
MKISLFTLLSKFDGSTEKEYKTYKELFIKKFELTKLPRYLIMSFKRFAKNTFFTEKNPTVVNFPVKGIDMAEYLSSDPKVQDAHPRTTYDLIANICHEGDPDL